MCTIRPNTSLAADGEVSYVVALSDCIVTASPSEVAPDVGPGVAVQFTAAPGETASANVVEAASASWWARQTQLICCLTDITTTLPVGNKPRCLRCILAMAWIALSIACICSAQALWSKGLDIGMCLMRLSQLL